MSQRTYIHHHGDLEEKIFIESIGAPSKDDGMEDVYHVTVTLHSGITITASLWTTQVKELIAQLESKGWKKKEIKDEPQREDQP